ncbi:hypothetical protein ONZ45_g13737 [Pleurotus djamor]|nr:hypothetical protein ONZ45_g13737 [Pleurotus djamor]
MGFFPLTLRVTGYLPPPALPPNYLGSTRSPLTEAEALVYKLPIILVEGQAVGSDHHPSEERVMKGSIRMIGDGAVRWTMKSRIVGTNRTEWVTEGIQMGAIGSALGVMGLWTGPEHQRHDPLGPWWMWKVSDTPAL